MNHETFNWDLEGFKLFGQSWSPENPKAVVCISHGFAEHSSRYQHVAEYFAQNGIATVALDHIGHGKSEGKRGYTPSYDYLLNGISDLLKQAESRFGNIPKFLYGHSMGGNIVINYLLMRKPTNINGAIATGPLLKLGFEPPAFKIFLAKLMRNIYPKFVEKANLDTSALARDSKVVKDYENDPLVHNEMTVSLFFPLFENGLSAIERAGSLSNKLLLFHGGSDTLTSPKGTEEFAANAPKDLVTFKIWDGYYHEIHNEPGNDKIVVLNEIKNWIEKNL